MSWFQTPEALCQVVEFLLIGISGLAIPHIKCSERLCQRQTIPSVKLDYFFPKWMLDRVLQFALRLSYMQGPELILRMPRVVPDNAPLMFLAVQGRIGEIQSLFAQGLASPFDVAASNGRTALHVRHCFNANRVLAYVVAVCCELQSLRIVQIPHRDRRKSRRRRQESSVCSLREAIVTTLNNARTSVALAWERIFGRTTETPNMTESWRCLFDDEEYLESRIFPVLHKTVLGLSQEDLHLHLQRSTALIDEQDVDGRTALSWAAAKSDLEVVNTLLKFGADPNICSKRGHTPLSWAAQSPAPARKDVMRALIENGADVNWVDSYKRTPLVYSTSDVDDPNCLHLLVDNGAKVNWRDCHKRTPLGYAAKMGQVGNLRYLLSRGADPGLSDHWGYTPLFEAVHQNHYEILEVLLDNDACVPSSKSHGGMSILHVVASFSDKRTTRILADRGVAKDLARDEHNHDGLTALDLFEGRQLIEREHRAAFDYLLDGVCGRSTSPSQFFNSSDDDSVDGEAFIDAVEVQIWD